MKMIMADLEGVFLPEIWINVARKTGIEALNLTTRDIRDYDVLMSRRLAILKENHLTIQDIQAVIATLDPLPGAQKILNWIRSCSQFIILSDTFEEFARPLMAKLGFPTLLCHSLSIDDQGNVTDYHLRVDNPKQKAVQAFQGLNYQVIAFGDSYNDIGMIQAADQGFFFQPPDTVVADFPDIPVTRNYDELKSRLTRLLNDS